MKDLTQRQKEILEFIEHHEWRNGYWPSIREIQEKFNFASTNAVMGHLRALEKKGVIERIAGQARTFRIHRPEESDLPDIPDDATEVVDVPVYGAIAAGYPDRVEPAGEIGRLQVDIRTAGFGNRRTSFALQVRGESMVDAEIYDGDMVIIEPREPRDGDIVAALIDHETTLKRYIKKPGEPPYLKAENKFYPELYPITELTVQGVAKAVVRSL
ncbi:transcriptional repressor LexA [Coraliomargarita parva]|uniref:transcriptional repressor LexA n=1 Tax=Coraliomargarita parva TaxID=3014050 RepID=UPI0022B2E795|nr:transcriptional repressor LexA [Coraliomargarita parva]